MKINKRGSQTEMMISFAIFVIFLAFVFIIIRPTKIGADENRILVQTLKNRLVGYIERDIVVSNLINTTKVETPCFYFSNINEGLGLKVITKDVNNKKIPTRIEGKRLYIGAPGGFFSIYYSSNLNEEIFTETNCKELKEGQYKIGQVKNITYISYDEIIKLKSRMDNPILYAELKKEFGFPNGNDFAFIFKDKNGGVIKSENKGNLSENVEIYSEELPINYIDNNANIYSGTITIQTW